MEAGVAFSFKLYLYLHIMFGLNKAHLDDHVDLQLASYNKRQQQLQLGKMTQYKQMTVFQLPYNHLESGEWAHGLQQSYGLDYHNLAKLVDLLHYNNINMPSELQEELIMNSLPYPENYNGTTWNSKIGRTRRRIPEYLRSDLPPLQYTYIRQEFKELDKIQCPRLAYFKNKIMIKRARHPDPPPALRRLSPMVNHQMQSAKLQKELGNIREQMKYALILTDKKSNVITELIDRANILQQQRDYQSKHKTKARNRRQSVRSIKQEDKCFPDTLRLVISARKQKSSNNTKWEQHVSPTAEHKLQTIKLLPLDVEHQYGWN